MGTPKVVVLQKVTLTFYADADLVPEGPVSALGRERAEVP